MSLPTGKIAHLMSARSKVNKALALALEYDFPDSVTKRLVLAFDELNDYINRKSAKTSTPKPAPAGDSTEVDADLMAELTAARAENASLKGSN